MISSVNITDPVYRKKAHSQVDRLFLKLLRDKRDLPFIYESIRLTIIMVPLAAVIYLQNLPGAFWWPLTILYIMLFIVFKGPYGLMLHCTSHRKMYKQKYDYMNKYVPWFLGLFFGQTPDTYFSHHLGMHHRENNLAPDKSTTMPYQRDSYKDFLRYYISFFFLGIYNLCIYFIKNKKKKLFIKSLRGELIYIALMTALAIYNFPATLAVFITPLIITRLIMMVGNWTQHSFVCPEDPGNPYKNSITCINNRYNRRCYNDGYHTNHHIMPSLHYTDHPVMLKKNLNKFATNRALIFDGLDFGGVFINLMLKRYHKLAEHVVNINDTFSSDEEIIALLKERTQYIPLTKER